MTTLWQNKERFLMKEMKLTFVLVTLTVAVSVLLVEADEHNRNKKRHLQKELWKTFNDALTAKKNADNRGISKIVEKLEIADPRRSKLMASTSKSAKRQFSDLCSLIEWFTCDNDFCIPPAYVCDEYNDCGDGSDEAGCGVTPTPSVPCDWSDWRDWTECNTGCDAGLRHRTRTCLCEGGGCEGESTEWEECPRDGCFPEAGNGCGTRVTKGATHRIVGGETAAEGAWPWQAQLLILGRTSSSLCGGTLVGPRYVISAAHCFENVDYSDSRNVRVYLGKLDLTLTLGDGETAVKKVIVHERYDEKTVDNDIAMIILAEDQSPSDHINFACLDVDHTKLFDSSSDCFTTGWGITAWEGEVASKLQEANVPLVDRATCTRREPYRSGVTDNMICAGFISGGIAACLGDSGGPLVCSAKDSDSDVERWYLVGVTSWTVIPCASPDYPVIYADVSKYTDWIQNHMKAN